MRANGSSGVALLMRRSMRHCLTQARFASAAAAGATPAASTIDVAPRERAEHDAFMSFATNELKITAFGAAPERLCSSSRHIRLNEAAKRGMVEETAATDAGEEEGPAFDFRGGRGLIATRDVAVGSPLLMAPLSTCSISVETLSRRAAAIAAVNGGRRYADAAADMNVAFAALPDTTIVHQIAADMLLRDPYYTVQFALATWVAWERCDPDSWTTPYLNSLPVPAVDDDVVLGLHAGSLTSFQSKEYLDLHKDFIVILRRIRDSWIDRVKRTSVDQATRDAALMRIPPMAVFDWSWRTVLARQAPLPPLGMAPSATCFRGDVNKSVNYAQWMELTGARGLLQPSLVPCFDLVDHHNIANCELDCIMRPVKSVDGHELDVEVMSKYIQAIKSFDLRHKHVVKLPEASPLYGGGIEQLSKTFYKVKAAADAAQRFITGDTETVAAHTPAAQSERLAATFESEVQSIAASSAHEPFVELRATTNVKAGDPLVFNFAHTHSWAFTLYRFGFVPQ